MRAVWCQNARPQLRLSGRASSSTTHASAILNRRTTTSPLRKRLTFSDAFTILLAPVLATAVVADISWKDKKRKDWDNKIAQVQQEIEQLQAQEVEAWTRLQLRSAKIGAAIQRRAYSTAARALVVEEEESVEEPSNHLSPFRDSIIDHAMKYAKANHDDVQSLTKLERLVAIRLAIQMLLHIHTGKSPLAPGLPQVYARPDAHDNVDLGKLISKLNYMNVRIWRFQPRENIRQVAMTQRRTPARNQLDGRIEELMADGNQNSLSGYQTIEAFAISILQANEAPTAWNYKSLIRYCTRRQLPDIAYMVIHAMGLSRTPLDDEAVAIILSAFGKWKDVYKADNLFKELTAVNGSYNFLNRWEWRRVSGRLIPVPSHSSPELLQMLTYANIRFKQVEKAEAYAALLEQTNGSGLVFHHVLKSFLHFYANERNWNSGKFWLWRCKTMVTSIFTNLDVLSRLIQRMLDFCVACRRQDEYQKILMAAVNAGIPSPSADAKVVYAVGAQCKAIIAEWYKLFQARWSNTSRAMPPSNSAQAFLDCLNRTELQDWECAAPPGGFESTSTVPNGSVHNMMEKWQYMIAEQQAHIKTLRHELEDTKAQLNEMSCLLLPGDKSASQIQSSREYTTMRLKPSTIQRARPSSLQTEPGTEHSEPLKPQKRHDPAETRPDRTPTTHYRISTLAQNDVTSSDAESILKQNQSMEGELTTTLEAENIYFRHGTFSNVRAPSATKFGSGIYTVRDQRWRNKKKSDPSSQSQPLSGVPSTQKTQISTSALAA